MSDPDVELSAASPVHDQRQQDDRQDDDDHPEEEHHNAGNGATGDGCSSRHGRQLPADAQFIRLRARPTFHAGQLGKMATVLAASTFIASTRVLRRGPALAAIMLALMLGGCTHLISVTGGNHHGLHRFRSGQCRPGDPLDGVYVPSRLIVKDRCVTVTGRVDCVRREPDGDVHIRLRLSRHYLRLLTPANAFQRCPGHPGPHLVVEIIPQHGELPFPDNSATRADFVTPKAPKPGQRIRVTGPYVWDTNALHDLIYPGRHIANWAEVHPAWNVTVIRRSR